MTKAFRYWIAGITLAATIMLIDCAALESCPRLFGGSILFRARCTPKIVEVYEPAPAAKPPAKAPLPMPPAKVPLPPAAKKDLPTSVKEIADLFKQGEIKEAHRLANLVAHDIEDIPDLMQMYRPRNKGGLGFAAIPQGNPANDSIEKAVRTLTRGAPVGPKLDYQEAETVGYRVAAMAEITIARAPKFNDAKQTKKWIESAEGLRKASLQLARASAANDRQIIQMSAIKIEEACTRCHATFKK